MEHDYSKMSLSQLGEELDRLDSVIAEGTKSLDELKRRKETLTFRILPEKMEEEGIPQFRLVSGRGITLTDEVLVSVLAEDREAQQAWLNDIGAEALIVPTVNPRSFQTFIKERMEAMQEVPSFVQVFARPRVKFLGAVKK